MIDADEERTGLSRRQITLRHDLLGGRHAAFGDLQRADAADGRIDLTHFRCAECEEEHVGRARCEIVGAADHVRNQHRRDVFFGQSASREDRLDHRIDRAHRRITHADLLALEVGDGLHRRILAHPEGAAQRMQRTDQAEIGIGGFCAFDFEDVGDAELGLAARYQRNHDRLAGGRLHHDVEAGLFLQHLGDRRGRGVIERARLHGGKAVGLRGGDACAEHKGRERSRREGGGSKCPNVNSDHCLSSQLIVSGYNGSCEAAAPPCPTGNFAQDGKQCEVARYSFCCLGTVPNDLNFPVAGNRRPRRIQCKCNN